MTAAMRKALNQLEDPMQNELRVRLYSDFCYTEVEFLEEESMIEEGPEKRIDQARMYDCDDSYEEIERDRLF